MNARIVGRKLAGGLRPALCALLLCAQAPDLAAESLTLSTTYPSPFGVYNQIVTTGNGSAGPVDTTLNRGAANTILVPPTNPGGKVGIGLINPAYKLDVAGVIHATDVCTDAAGGACLSDSREHAAVFNSVPLALSGGSAGCESGWSCTSWQALPGATSPLAISRNSRILVTFMGNYNCDGCLGVNQYMDARLLMSVNGQSYVLLEPGTSNAPAALPNAGAVLMRAKIISASAGNTYSFKIEHRYTRLNGDGTIRVVMVEGLISARSVP